MKKKLVISCVLLCVMLCTIFTPVCAASSSPDAQEYNVDIYMHDNASMISASDEQEIIDTILEECEDLDFHLNVLVLTYNQSNGESTMVYTDNYMDDLFPSSENNIGFVIDYTQDTIYINTMGERINRISDDEVEQCIDKAWPYFEDYEDGAALNALAKAGCKKLTGQSIGNNFKLLSYMLNPIALIGSALASIVVMLIINGQHNKENKVIQASEYITENGFDVINKNETQTKTYTTRTKISSSSSGSSGSRSRGSSHRSSSGRSHGGGGRRR